MTDRATGSPARSGPGRCREAALAALGVLTGPHYFFYRHSWWVRVAHWLNALCLAILPMSGLSIFNAHPALYIGNGSNFERPLLSLTAQQNNDGSLDRPDLDRRCIPLNTTGILGASKEDGQWMQRGFPSWATLPGPQWLAMGRQWHFAFAWILVINGLLFFAYAFLERPFPPRPGADKKRTSPACRTRSWNTPGCIFRCMARRRGITMVCRSWPMCRLFSSWGR